MELASYS
jgi:pimeloyl-ACP methyl ester carboxylesterase